jgi:hypothetical protein
MNEALRAILGDWSESWRYPDLVALLARGDRGDLDPAEAAQALIAGIANPRTWREAFETLARAGEFLAAEALLEDHGHRVGFEPGDQEELRRLLDGSKAAARAELNALAVSLAGRAGRVEMVAAVSEEEIGGALTRSRAEAERLLNAWEQELRKAEEQVTRGLRARLEEVPAGVSPGQDEEAWRAAVGRCIKAREFDAARFLLDTGPSPTLAVDEPSAVPRLPTWPWDEPLPELLGWFLGRDAAPREFATRCRPAPGDVAASALLNTLDQLARSPVRDAAQAADFAVILDAFIGLTEPPSRPAEPRGDGFETRLYGLRNSRLPALAAAGAGGVRFWLPRTPKAVPPEVRPGESLGLAFVPETAPTSARGLVWFDARALFRLMSDSAHRQIHFLRELGARMRLEDIVPEWADGALSLPKDAADLRVYAAWLFDIANLQVEGPELADVIVYYSGAKPALLLQLTRALLLETPGRLSPLRLTDLERAWYAPTFRATARAYLLAPLASDALARATLGATLYALPSSDREVYVADVASALDLLGFTKTDEAGVRRDLDRLAATGLLRADPARNSYGLPHSGIGHLLLDAVGDPEAFVREVGTDGVFMGTVTGAGS